MLKLNVKRNNLSSKIEINLKILKQGQKATSIKIEI